ncbi:MAG: 4'-phosphopantetheinyl transferase superfamily protein [Phormidesmis sp.]
MSDAIQLWKVPLVVAEDVLSTYFFCLSEDEKARANRFRFANDRRRFVTARGTLRYLLGRQFGQPPQAVEFCYGQYGKPRMEQMPNVLAATAIKPCDFHFNLSHSGELALCVLGYHRQVGVDVEIVKPIKRLESLMSRCLVDWEQAQVKAETLEGQPRAFLQRWTCKEAYLKAIGLGLIQSMQTVEVDCTVPRLVKVPDNCLAEWRLHLVPLPDDYVGALVVAGDAAVEVFDWQHS